MFGCTWPWCGHQDDSSRRHNQKRRSVPSIFGCPCLALRRVSEIVLPNPSPFLRFSTDHQPLIYLAIRDICAPSGNRPLLFQRVETTYFTFTWCNFVGVLDGGRPHGREGEAVQHLRREHPPRVPKHLRRRKQKKHEPMGKAIGLRRRHVVLTPTECTGMRSSQPMGRACCFPSQQGRRAYLTGYYPVQAFDAGYGTNSTCAMLEASCHGAVPPTQQPSFTNIATASPDEQLKPVRFSTVESRQFGFGGSSPDELPVPVTPHNYYGGTYEFYS